MLCTFLTFLNVFELAHEKVQGRRKEKIVLFRKSMTIFEPALQGDFKAYDNCFVIFLNDLTHPSMKEGY